MKYLLTIALLLPILAHAKIHPNTADYLRSVPHEKLAEIVTINVAKVDPGTTHTTSQTITYWCSTAQHDEWCGWIDVSVPLSQSKSFLRRYKTETKYRPTTGYNSAIDTKKLRGVFLVTPSGKYYIESDPTQINRFQTMGKDGRARYRARLLGHEPTSAPQTIVRKPKPKPKAAPPPSLPKGVTLEEITVPLMHRGQPVGEATFPPGTKCRIARQIDENTLLIDIGKHRTKVSSDLIYAPENSKNAEQSADQSPSP